MPGSSALRWPTASSLRTRAADDSPEREQPLRMLAQEPRHRLCVPPVTSGQEPLVDDGLVLVVYDRRRDPPPLPARLNSAESEIDVLDADLAPGVPAAQLRYRRATHQTAA